MNSTQRHEVRYQRRKRARQEKVEKRSECYSHFEDVFGIHTMNQKWKRCRIGVRWKPEVQAYSANRCISMQNDSDMIRIGTWKSGHFREFNLFERGKLRHVHAVRFAERVVQNSFCDNCLVPILTPSLIYENGASIKGKGTDFNLDLLTRQLREHIRKHGLKGGIYQYDFSGYFAGIDIGLCEMLVNGKLKDPLMQKVYHEIIMAYGGNGLGLGAQVSQISAVFFPNLADHFVKDHCGVHGYGRYMDDGYIICEDIDRLRTIAKEFERICEDRLHIRMNRKKCHVIRFGDDFRFLKIRFRLKNGRVIKRIDRKAISKERRRIRAYRKLVSNGKITFEEVRQIFHSWLCMMKRGKSFRIRENLIRYFNQLFAGIGRYHAPKKRKNHDLIYLERVCTRMTG